MSDPGHIPRDRGRPRITEDQIREIYLGILAGEPKTEIEIRVKVDRSTIYKYARIVQTYPERHIYSLIAATKPKFCHLGHTALKCLVCGKIADNINTSEFHEIATLRRRLRQLEGKEIENYAETDYTTLRNPVTDVTP